MHKERQSGIRYLLTEADLRQRLAIPIGSPIRVFSLKGLGIDTEAFINELGPSFDELGWDEYIVAAKRVEMLIERFPDQRARLETFLQGYYRDGDDALTDIVDLLRRLSPRDRSTFDNIRTYRRRSIARFVVTNRFTATWEDQWHVEQTLIEAFEQDVGDTDFRKLERRFDPTAEHVIDHPGFQRLLIAVAEMVEDAEHEFDLDPVEMEVTFHQMGQIARPGEAESMANEGLHKDGADYIVSALVLRRDNVHGGRSIVKGGDKTTTYLDVKLQPGEGLFQADHRSELWHDVTPVEVRDDTDQEEGVRDIFGFDVVVTHRKPRKTT